MLALEAASFWRATVIAVVTMSFSKCRSGGNKLSNVRGFSILHPGKALTFFNKGNCTYFLDEKKAQLSFSRNPFFRNTREIFSVNTFT